MWKQIHDFIYNIDILLFVLLHRRDFNMWKSSVVWTVHIFHMFCLYKFLTFVSPEVLSRLFPCACWAAGFQVRGIDLLIHWHPEYKRTCIKVLIFRNVTLEVTIDVPYQTWWMYLCIISQAYTLQCKSLL